MAGMHRSGRPHHLNFTTKNGTKEQWALPGDCQRLILQNTHLTQDVECFFTKAAADLGAGFGLTVEPRKHLDLECQLIEMWTISSGGTCTIEVLAIIR